MQGLLLRQLRRLGLDRETPPADVAAWQAFLARVDRAYTDFEDERYTRERSMELVTSEMQDLYASVRIEHERLQELITYLGIGLISLDDRCRIRVANPDARQMLGWDEGDFADECVFTRLDVTGADGTPIALDEVVRTGTATRGVDASFLTRTGERLPVAFVLNSVEKDGRVLGAYLVFNDIRQRKQTEAQMRHARELAEQASRSKSEFVATMSHELGTPLNGVIGMLELLSDSDLDSSQHELLGAAKRSARTLAVIVQDVLDFSRLESGQMLLEPRPTDLRTLAHETLEQSRAGAAAKGITLELDWRAGDLPAALADSARLGQVLHNLVSNAVKFTAKGGVTLTIERAREHESLLDVRFAVRDTGPGIKPELQERLFEKFWQEDGSYSRRHGGTGLGLAICKRLVEAMEGRIGALSAPGEGSTFWFEVSLARVAPQTESAAPEADDDGPLALDGVRVLVVEDTPVNQKITMRLLERLGCDVELACDGREALASFRAATFDLVLMDCQMPGMDGYETTTVIRGLEGGRSHVPIVALTANTQPSDRERCAAAGMDDFLAKPIQVRELHRVLRRWLVRRAA